MYTVRAYVIGEDKIVEAREGDGSNLLDEDLEAGYVDYIYYTVYDVTNLDNVFEDDGGMILLKEPFSKTYAWKGVMVKDSPYNVIDDDKVVRDVMDFIGYSDYIML